MLLYADELACYAQGLHDKEMKLLNTFGVTASVFHINQYGSWWAKIRKAINIKAFWRVTYILESKLQ